MIGLNLWGKGSLRMLCAIIGVVCGYVAAVAIGAFDPKPHAGSCRTRRCLRCRRGTPKLPQFSAELVVPFMAAALTCALRAMGDISRRAEDQ